MDRHRPGRALGQARTRGQALVEWAILLTVLLWVCLAGVDLGRAYGDYLGLTNAARAGARYAVLLPGATDAQIVAQVQAEQPSLGITAAIVAVDRTLTDRRTVTVAYPFAPFTPLVARFGDGTSLTLTTWAAMPLSGS
jgi:Flp pilus assembly protein TadG